MRNATRKLPVIETINGSLVAEPPFAPLLTEAGFVRDYRGDTAVNASVQSVARVRRHGEQSKGLLDSDLAVPGAFSGDLLGRCPKATR